MSGALGLHPYITLDNWRRSVICLGYHIAQLNRDNNLMPEGAAARGEYFFAEGGVPLPRPCTLLAWSSLISLTPIQGFIQNGQHRPFHLDSGPILIPFLPKLNANEDTNQSLIRTSKAHTRDSHGKIKWGSIYVADANSGRLIMEYPHGGISAKEAFSQGLDSNQIRLNSFTNSHPIPALFANESDGWQHGVCQSYAGLNVSLRDPFIELAKAGIPSLSRYPRIPRIRRLLFRFLQSTSAGVFARAYAESASVISEASEEAAVEDARLLAQEINQAEERRFKEMAAKTQRPKGRAGFGAALFAEDDLATLRVTSEVINKL